MRYLKFKNISSVFHSSNLSFQAKLLTSTSCNSSLFPNFLRITYSPHASFTSTPFFGFMLSKNLLNSFSELNPSNESDELHQISFIEHSIENLSESTSISNDSEHKIKKPITELTDEELMRKMLHNASVGFTLVTFKCLEHLINRGVILSFHQWMCVFNTYRKRVTTKADVEQMMSILNYMESQLGKLPLPSLEVTLVRAAQSKMIDQVNFLLRKIQMEYSDQLTVPVISAVINVYHKLGLSEQALTFFETVPKSFPPTIFHPILIKLHGSLGNLEKAETLYNELISSNPDALTMVSGSSRMAYYYMQHQQLRKAKKIMDQLNDLHYKLIPISYVVLVDIALAEGDMEKALTYCRQSMSNAKKPHFAFLVHILMQKLLDRSSGFFDLKKAESLISAYKHKSLEFKGKASVPYYPYAPLLEYYAQYTENKAHIFFNSIPGNPYKYDYAVIMMMRAFLLAGKKNKAEEFLNHCSLRGYVPGPKSPTLSNYESIPVLQVSKN